VVYFYPSAYTKGCDLEAHTFAEKKDKFDAAGATIIGVSADSIARLNQFSADPEYCAGKFPVASDANREIAASYNLATTAVKPGQMDVRGTAIDHDFIERETFVIGKDHKIIATFSSKDDNLSPDAHVEKIVGDCAAARLQIARLDVLIRPLRKSSSDALVLAKWLITRHSCVGGVVSRHVGRARFPSHRGWRFLGPAAAGIPWTSTVYMFTAVERPEVR